MGKLLIITTGTTDVQIVKEGRRRELSKQKCGELLDHLVTLNYTFCDTLPKKDKDPIVDKNELLQGDFQVCTPKLDAVLRHFEGSMPDAVLILETNRSLESDPRQAGAVLQKRLQEYGVQQIRRHPFLKDQERLEDSKDERDAVVRREVVLRLAEAIQHAFKWEPTHIYTALAGGIPEANDVIDQLVRLYAVASPKECHVTSLKVPDGTKVEQEDRAVPEPFHPAAAIRAHWHALDLIQKGNLLAAWGAVSHLENQPGQEWTQIVRWLADFAASLPIAAECDIAVLKHPKMAVRAALRVELALRAGDIPRAVHGTVAFFEAALWDWLHEHFERSTDPKKRRYYKLRPNGRVPGADLMRKGDSSGEDRKRPFEQKEQEDGVQWYWIYDDDACAGKIAKDYLKSDPLHKLCSAVSKIRYLRNDVAHNEPTPELMREAKDRMTDEGLWSTDNPPSFLSQSLVQGVLREFEEQEPEKLCTRLIEDVRLRLLRFSE